MHAPTYYAQNIAFMLALCFMPEYIYIMCQNYATVIGLGLLIGLKLNLLGEILRLFPRSIWLESERL